MLSLRDSGQYEHQRKRLVQLLDESAVQEGSHPSAIRGVELTRRSEAAPREPVVYKPGVVIVGQGKKRCFLGDQVFVYDPYNYLVLSVPLPFERDIECSREEPLLVVTVQIDPPMIGEMLLDIDEPLPKTALVPRAVCTTPLDERLGGAVIRLLECLKTPRDSKVLGPQIVREIVYLVVVGERGDALRALAARNERFEQIARVLRHIHADPSRDFTMESLARQAGMSVSTFHHTFKQMTASSPLQYVKRIRLDRALRLMAHDGNNASSAAAMVGYESASQFSREFKRLYGTSPVEEAAKVRARLTR